MMRTKGRAARLAVIAALTASGTAVLPVTNVGAHHSDDAEPALPIVFVHGFSGSGAQYETQALRWASNHYPNVVTAIDRTSSTPSVIYPILDDFFDDLMASTGDSQVYALGHSAGTAVMNGYLNSSSERAARVAKYIGIDGATSQTCPGDVACMGIWARGSDTRVLGDNNARFPDQGHTESVGSPESFAAQYEFFTGEAPQTTEVVAERGHVEVSGRALNFPANTGIEGAMLEVWKVKERNGRRTSRWPVATAEIGADGNFGPIRVNSHQRYELTVIREADGDTYYQHFYYEPWTRDNRLLRLNLAPIGSALADAIERGPHAVASVVRQREWWGDDNPVDPADVDDLFVSTKLPGPGDQDPIDIVNGATAPYTASTIAIITFDIGSDGNTDVSQLYNLGPFLSGVDTYMPGTEPPRGTVRFEHHQRGADRAQVISTPNWSSEAGHSMTVTFRDWVDDHGATAGIPSPSPAGSNERTASLNDRGVVRYCRFVAVEQRITGGRTTGMPPTARGRRTRAQLVAAAKAVFQETPFATARIADITQVARVSTGTFYVYFDSKEEIFREVAADVLAEMSAAPRRRPDNGDRDPIRDIARATRRYFQTCLDNAGIARSIEQLTLTDDAVSAERRNIVVDGVRRAERWIADLQDRGICDTAIDPWTTAMALHTMTVRVAYDHLMPSGGADLDAIVEAVTHVWARTVGLERLPSRNPR